MTRLHQRTIDILRVKQRLTGEELLVERTYNTDALDAIFKDVFADGIGQPISNFFPLKALPR